MDAYCHIPIFKSLSLAIWYIPMKYQLWEWRQLPKKKNHVQMLRKLVYQNTNIFLKLVLIQFPLLSASHDSRTSNSIQFYQGKCKLLSKYSFARANKYDNPVSVSSLLFPFLILWGRSVNKLLPQSMSFSKMTKSQPARIDFTVWPLHHIYSEIILEFWHISSCY